MNGEPAKLLRCVHNLNIYDLLEWNEDALVVARR